MADEQMSQCQFAELRRRFLGNRKATLDERLQLLLAKHRTRRCKECGHRIGWGDIAWSNGSTEVGTGYCSVEIQCAVCNHEIVYFNSWYPGIESRNELLYVLNNDWYNRV